MQKRLIALGIALVGVLIGLMQAATDAGGRWCPVNC